MNEWSDGVYKDAILLNLNKIKTDAPKKLNPNDLYYLHCKTGGRSGMAYGLFRKMGFNVVNIKGGYLEMVKCGMNPVTKDLTGK